jgi:xanthine dehydrogenase accessory factor
MLVFPDGAQAGTLGGGCVEAEVRQRALRLVNESGARAEVYTFNLDDNYGWDDGLICGGRMTMLVDPIANGNRKASPDDYFSELRARVEAGTGCVEAVVLNESAGLPAGSRYLFDDQRHMLAMRAGREPTKELMDSVPDLADRPRPAVIKGTSFLPVLPRVRLFIVGGGHVGQALARLAAEVDFDIWVLDDREKYACRERFPQAERLLVGDIGQTLKKLVTGREITPATWSLIMTRGHSHDEEALFHLAPIPSGYVGMIGSRRKIKLIYEDLRARGIRDELLEKVHAPLGLEIGSQTVPEIAVSIVAELIACRNRGGKQRSGIGG